MSALWIKICGMTDADAIAAALAAGANAIGFVFAPSVRHVTPAQATRLAASVRGRIELVAVTLHPTQALIDEILQQLRPDTLQSDWRDFASLRLPDTLLRLPVLRVGDGAGAEAAEAAQAAQAAGAAGAAAASAVGAGGDESQLEGGRILFEGALSGRGEAADWQQAARLARAHRLVLAGGLHAANVGAAIEAVHPFGVDVSSGVESAPGRKSAQLVTLFVQRARAAEQVLQQRQRTTMECSGG